MIRTEALFTNLCVAWYNMPPHHQNMIRGVKAGARVFLSERGLRALDNEFSIVKPCYKKNMVQI